MDSSDLLVLNYEGFAERTAFLFEKLTESSELRDAFVNNPTTVLSKVFLPPNRRATDQQISQGNKLLYSLLSNPDFVTFGQQCSASVQSEVAHIMEDEEDPVKAFKLFLAKLDRTALYERMIHGILDYADEELIFSIMGSGSETVSGDLKVDGFDLSELKELVQVFPRDTVNYFETMNFVYIATVCLVVLIFIDLSFTSPDPTFSRVDLKRLSDLVADRLMKRADQARSAGELVP